MPCLSWRLTDGPLGAPREDATIVEAGRWLPEGAYTTLRSYGGDGLLRLSAHVARLEETMALLGHPWRAERGALWARLCSALGALPWAGESESRLRLTVDGTGEIGALWLSAEPLQTPGEAARRQGVAALTRPMHRANPRAKNSAFIAASAEARALIGGGVDEVLMVEAGNVLEGLSSNFFAVRGGTLLTAEEGVLPGITRSLVLELAERLALPVRREAVAVAELPLLEEAFLSSTSRDILPVVEIDGQPIGTGRPGPLTRALAAAFAEAVENEIERPCAG